LSLKEAEQEGTLLGRGESFSRYRGENEDAEGGNIKYKINAFFD
jgi:hypothetical protein